MARYGKDLNENDIQKFFMTFDKTPYRNNQMFIVEGIDQVDEKTIPIVKYAVFDGTFTRPERMTHHELEKEIIEIPIPPNLIHLMREYVSSSLSEDERLAVQQRRELAMQERRSRARARGGNTKKTRRYKRKSSKSRKSRKHRKSYKGGAHYGTGVGSNCYDPNFSIYNTRELQLFPYRPTN
jgi:hypothetical protein